MSEGYQPSAKTKLKGEQYSATNAAVRTGQHVGISDYFVLLSSMPPPYLLCKFFPFCMAPPVHPP
jgi:hypothetical protein